MQGIHPDRDLWIWNQNCPNFLQMRTCFSSTIKNSAQPTATSERCQLFYLTLDFQAHLPGKFPLLLISGFRYQDFISGLELAGEPLDGAGGKGRGRNSQARLGSSSAGSPHSWFFLQNPTVVVFFCRTHPWGTEHQDFCPPALPRGAGHH